MNETMLDYVARYIYEDRDMSNVATWEEYLKAYPGCLEHYRDKARTAINAVKSYKESEHE